jgi:hypothetical protein
VAPETELSLGFRIVSVIARCFAKYSVKSNEVHVFAVGAVRAAPKTRIAIQPTE